MDFELTKEEKNAIASLERLAKRWPQSLWLSSANGSLCVMRYKENGDRMLYSHGGMHHDAIVTVIQGIPNDGGDW